MVRSLWFPVYAAAPHFAHLSAILVQFRDNLINSLLRSEISNSLLSAALECLFCVACVDLVRPHYFYLIYREGSFFIVFIVLVSDGNAAWRCGGLPCL